MCCRCALACWASWRRKASASDLASASVMRGIASRVAATMNFSKTIAMIETTFVKTENVGFAGFHKNGTSPSRSKRTLRITSDVIPHLLAVTAPELAVAVDGCACSYLHDALGRPLCHAQRW